MPCQQGCCWQERIIQQDNSNNNNSNKSNNNNKSNKSNNNNKSNHQQYHQQQHQKQQQQQQQHQAQDNNPPPSSLSITKFTAVDADHVLNIHIVPHTHNDVGWRKTVAQYYSSSNNNNQSIDNRGNVRNILSTTVAALLQHTARTFVYAEMKFFSTWWYEQQQLQLQQQQSEESNNNNNNNNNNNAALLHDNDDVLLHLQDAVRYLLASQQWSFVGGGWCMHDEAAAHYIGMLDQTATGHAFLQREFGPSKQKQQQQQQPKQQQPHIVTTGWQLDPFGHSATHAALLSQSYDAMYFGRIDYQDLALRQLTRQCEGLWDAAASSAAAAGAANNNNNNNTQEANKFFHPLFWGLTGSYRGNYGAPDTFCFDVLCQNDAYGNEPLIGIVNETRLLERLTTFLQDMRIQADQTVDNHIMVTMGSDFNVSEV